MTFLHNSATFHATLHCQYVTFRAQIALYSHTTTQTDAVSSSTSVLVVWSSVSRFWVFWLTFATFTGVDKCKDAKYQPVDVRHCLDEDLCVHYAAKKTDRTDLVCVKIIRFLTDRRRKNVRLPVEAFLARISSRDLKKKIRFPYRSICFCTYLFYLCHYN